MIFHSLKQFFSAPSFPDEEKTRRAGLLSFLINLHILVAVSTTILLVLFADFPPIFPLAAFISCLPGLALRLLMHRGRVTVASVLFVSMIFSIMPTLAWFSGSSAASVSVTIFQTIAIVMSGLLLGGRGAAVFVILTGLVNGALINAEIKGIYEVDTSRDPVSILVMQVIAFSAISAMLFVTNRLIRESFARARRENEERQQAKSARQRLEELYRRAIEAAGAVPYVFDPATRTLRFLGDGILSMTGYPASELMSYDQWKKVEQVGFPRGKLAHLTYEEADRLTDEDDSIPWECDFRIRTRDGQTRWIADTSVKGFDETGEHIVAVGLKQDITERKRVEEEIKQLNLELEQRVRARTAELEAANKELEAFSYSVSHDLRAPLRAINGFARILEEDFSTEFSPPARNSLQKISASGKKMGQLIDDLLDFSRLGRKPLNRQIVAVESIVHSVIESLAPETAGRQIEWVLPALPSITADPALLQQVYANLIGNAVKYSRNRAPARIEIGSFAQNSETIYFVRDNGAGFDMKYADRLFGVFQRLHRDDEFEGTGIGLATVQRIIQRHGGRIWAEAEVDKGATFYFTLGQVNGGKLAP